MAEKERLCRITGASFMLSQRELDGYAYFDLPLPDLSPEERYRRLLAFHNAKHLFWRKCDRSGERIFSVLGPHAPFPVLKAEHYRSAGWSPLSMGIPFDPRRLFFEQLLELWRNVPRPSVVSERVIQGPVVHDVTGSDECFLVFDSYDVEQCSYSSELRTCSRCIDCLNIEHCTFCYECIDCFECSSLRFSRHATRCADSWFLFNCRDCTHCFGCTNLQGRQFCFFNEQLGEVDYRKRVADLGVHARPMLELARNRMQGMIDQVTLPHLIGDAPPGVSGNYLRLTENSVGSFECSFSTELLRCHNVHYAERCLDGYWGYDISDSAQFVACGRHASRLLNCVECWNDVHDLSYSAYCEQSANLFGCVGLRGKEYCIMNVQFSKEDYERQRAEIERHLRKRHLWGQFFPPNYSSYPYNRSAADERMPLAKVPAKLMGFPWDDDDKPIGPSELLGTGDVPPAELFAEVPHTAAELDNADLRATTFICELSGAPFQLTRSELALYRQLEVPPPTRSFEQRHRERVSALAPHRLSRKLCAESGNRVETSFGDRYRNPIVSHDLLHEELKRSTPES